MCIALHLLAAFNSQHYFFNIFVDCLVALFHDCKPLKINFHCLSNLFDQDLHTSETTAEIFGGIFKNSNVLQMLH